MRTLVIMCLAAALLPLIPWRANFAASGAAAQPEQWPEPFRGMKELPLSDTETRFATESSVRVAHFTSDGHDWIVRWIGEASRRVHPPEECYRATGWQVHPLPMRLSTRDQQRWGCFAGVRGATRIEACQIIIDSRGRSWSDAGSWWWSAILGRTTQPWFAILDVQTKAAPVEPGESAARPVAGQNSDSRP